MPSNEKYMPKPGDAREIQVYFKQVEEINKAPLSERKKAAAEYGKYMREFPKTVAERVQWLLVGNFGYGSYVKARQIAVSKGMNRVAVLANMTAELEWQCPAKMASDEWKKLTPAQQHAVNTAVAKEIQNWEEEEGIKAAPVIGVSSHVPELRRKKPVRPRLSR